VAVERSELELVWPPDLFRQEGQALLDAGNEDESRLGWLLAEAFHGDRGYQLFTQTPAALKGWGEIRPIGARAPAPVQGPSPRAQLVTGLVRDSDQLPRYVPRQLYSARGNPRPEAPLTLSQAKTGYAEVVATLAGTGYFHEAFGSSCVDDADDPAEQGQKQLASLLDTDHSIWPLARADEESAGVEQEWPEEVFFDVVEALHDLVARPRSRFWHDYGQEWDYADFARTPGQAVYRWKVNDVLARSQIPLRLAGSGSDRGRLVHAPGDARDELLRRAQQSSEPKVRDLVDHAVVQFRGRGATFLAKREATRTLADVLEHRKELLKTELFKKDEDALFHIANAFEIRHTNESQKGDYDPAFLDWVFWWYLATIELTDRLLARQVPSP
jgi:hypothetical protein